MTDLRDETPAPGQPIRDLSSSEERLLTAATMLFSDRGFEATTTRDISAMAGLSPAAMYVHFPSKEELLFRLVCRAHERALAQVLDALDKVLIPGATNAELKALLVKVRPAFAAHLEHAKNLRASLGQGQ